jgi:hypothetical protein
MKNIMPRVSKTALFALSACLFGAGLSCPANAQNQELQERVAELKQAAAKNKQELAQCTWVEQVTIS